jgi:hypothetical protein
MKRTIAVVTLLFALTLMALAHGKEKHVMGTVTRISDSSVTAENIDSRVLIFTAARPRSRHLRLYRTKQKEPDQEGFTKVHLVHIDIQIPKQEQQHYHHQDYPDDSQHPKAFANRKLFYRLSSAPGWPTVVHEDGGTKVREVKTKSSHAIPLADCSRSLGWNT